MCAVFTQRVMALPEIYLRASVCDLKDVGRKIIAMRYPPRR